MLFCANKFDRETNEKSKSFFNSFIIIMFLILGAACIATSLSLIILK